MLPLLKILKDLNWFGFEFDVGVLWAGLIRPWVGNGARHGPAECFFLRKSESLSY